MKRLVVLLPIIVVAMPVLAEMQVSRGPEASEFRANIRPELTEVNPDEYFFLARYFDVLADTSGRQTPYPREFQWCWSQRVVGWADQVRLRGDWIFCGHEDLMTTDPFTSLDFGPEVYGIPGIIRTVNGDIYTWTARAAGWDGDELGGYGGLTRFFGGTGAFNYAQGWTTDRPKAYPPSSWMRSQGQVSVIGEDAEDHPSWYQNPEGATKISFPARLPGNIDFPGDEDYFVFEAKQGWRYNFGTTLGTLDDSLIALDGYIDGPEECYFGQWREDDGEWDGEGSVLGAFTAPADCTYLLMVIDWARAGTSYMGTYTFWGEEWLP